MSELVGADFGGRSFDAPNCPRCLERCELEGEVGQEVARCVGCGYVLTEAEAFGL